MTETRSSTKPGDGMTLGGGMDDRALARDRRAVESPFRYLNRACPPAAAPSVPRGSSPTFQRADGVVVLVETGQPEIGRLSAQQIAEIVHEVSCGPIRFSAWARGDEVHIGVEGDSCPGAVEYSIGVDEFGTVGEVLDHLRSEAKRFLQEQFTYRGLEVEFREARSDAEEGAG